MQISVIIPMYNESRYVERCLDSLLQQTFFDFELIIIDDGSTDNSISIVESYYSRFKKLTILKQNHWWPGKARNWWAEISIGKILVFVDADMVFDKNYLKELIAPIQQWKEIGTAHWQEYVANKNNPIARAFSLVRLSYNSKKPRWWVFRAICKDDFLKAGWFDISKWYTDDDLSKKIGSSLSIEKAIAYHNNPESFMEIYRHSQWVGWSLTKTWEIKYYILKYIWRILWCISWLIVLWLLFGINILLISPLLLIIFAILLKSLQRTVYEGYYSHILYIPWVMIVRGIWYIVWWLRYLFNNKIY